MKQFLVWILFFVFMLGYSQKKKDIVFSNTANVSIIESGEIKTPWSLNPDLKPDTYITGKISKQKKVKLVTDIDSIEVSLKPGQQYDFMVVLKGKDSCYTRFEAPEAVNFKKIRPVKRDTIPFELTEFNNIKVKAILNGKDSLDLMFDTGSTDFYLTKAAIRKYLNPEGIKLTMDDISDESFSIGNLQWQHQQIYPVDEVGQGTDGMFGWNMFDGKVLEIDYDKGLMIVHTKRPKIGQEYEKFTMELMKEHFCISAEVTENGRKVTQRYLFDTGYQRAIMLDKGMLSGAAFPVDELKALSETKMYNSANEEIPVVTANVQKFRLGKFVLQNVPAQINAYNRPAGFSTHFLGNEILKRFNAIIDFQRNVVYLKPNKKFNDKYTVNGVK